MVKVPDLTKRIGGVFTHILIDLDPAGGYRVAQKLINQVFVLSQTA